MLSGLVGTHWVNQAGLELPEILLPLPSQCATTPSLSSPLKICLIILNIYEINLVSFRHPNPLPPTDILLNVSSTSSVWPTELGVIC